jgi:fluoride exporter
MIALYVALGGAVGAAGRFYVAEWARSVLPVGTLFPWATFAINLLGSFVLGVVLKWSQVAATPSLEWRAFAAIGVCGGFTTFSTFSAETLALLDNGEWPRAVAYASLSVLLCVAAVAAGFVVARALARA